MTNSPPPASQALSASLVQRPGGRIWRVLRWPRFIFLIVLGIFAGQTDSEPFGQGKIDLVVHWRDSGAELLRVQGADDHLLSHVTTQLDELSVEEFCERWGVSSSSASPDGPGTVTA